MLKGTIAIIYIYFVFNVNSEKEYHIHSFVLLRSKYFQLLIYGPYQQQKFQNIEVEFPDLQGCFTFGKDWEEALENAEDALAAWLVNAELEFIKEPFTIENGLLTPTFKSRRYAVEKKYKELFQKIYKSVNG